MKLKTSILTTLSIGTLSLIQFIQITSAFGDSNPCSQNSATAGMKQDYCDAASAQQGAATSNTVVSGIFGAAGAVCATACFTKDPISSTNLEAACSVGSVGAGASDIVATQQFNGAMGSLVSVVELKKNVGAAWNQFKNAPNAAAQGGTQAGNAATPPGVTVNAIPDEAPLNVSITTYDPTTGVTVEPYTDGSNVSTSATQGATNTASTGATQGATNTASTTATNGATNGASNGASNGAANGADKAGVQKADKGDSKTSCLAAAMDVGTAGMKMFSANEADKAAQKNIENATGVESTVAESRFAFNAPGSSSAALAGGAIGGSGASNKSGTPTVSGSSSISAQGGGGSCANARATGNLQSALTCAAATGTSLPSIVQHPNFGEMIKKATGMDAADFLKKAMNEGSGKAVGDAVVQSAGLSGNAAIQTTAAFSAFERAGYESSAGMYTGSGARKGNSDNAADLGQMVQGLMAQLNPKTGSQGNPTQISQLQLKKSVERFPANVAEDRRVSLFERVTHRYQVVTNRVMPGQK